MMNQYFRQTISLFLVLFLSTGLAQAAPRILRSNTAGNTALWISLKKEARGEYLLQVAKEGEKGPERFKLTADSTGASNGMLKFASGEEAKASAALKGFEDVIAHTAANDAEATGDAAGDINSFVNGVVRRDGAEGLLLLPAAAPTNTAPPASGGVNWLWIIAALIVGGAGGWMINKAVVAGAVPVTFKEVEEEEPIASTIGKGTDIHTAEQNAQKLKKAQKELKDTKAALTQMTKKTEREIARNTELEGDYNALEARLKVANSTIAAVQQQAGSIETQLRQLQDQAAKQEAYFKTAANAIVRPFTDYVSSSKFNPIDQTSQAIVEEQMVIMAFHYFSLVRYGAGIWDEHDIYNLQRNGPLGSEHKAAHPQGLPLAVKSGAPNLLLAVAALLRQSGATGAGMDISIRGYRFEQSAG